MLRDRPAYYYTQSSVIPYRMRNGNPEILVILSSQKKHFVVPKGIKDPGLSPQDSAAKEAWEEAGVEGEVKDPALGCYRYEKWGSICTVDVYAMEVTAVVPEHEWQESHRGREWVSPAEAMKRSSRRRLRPWCALLQKNCAPIERYESNDHEWQSKRPGGDMARLFAALIRHGEYAQLPDTPSAHQPFALTDKGRAQAYDAAADSTM